MKTPNQPGKNRTGIQASPIDARRLEHSARASVPSSVGGESLLAKVRLDVARLSEPVGTMPPPATVKGVAKTAVGLLKGDNLLVFLNKLGERLAFERTGVRLYEAVIDKLPAFNLDGSGGVGPTIAELRAIQEDELRHVDVVRRAIESLGGDPTALTPAADVVAVASTGVVQVASDPRCQVAESLQALLVAELVDNDGWELLVQLARGLQQEELAASFMLASDQEHVHLIRLRAWLTAVTLRDAGIDAAAAATPPAAP